MWVLSTLSTESPASASTHHGRSGGQGPVWRILADWVHTSTFSEIQILINVSHSEKHKLRINRNEFSKAIYIYFEDTVQIMVLGQIENSAGSSTITITNNLIGLPLPSVCPCQLRLGKGQSSLDPVVASEGRMIYNQVVATPLAS